MRRKRLKALLTAGAAVASAAAAWADLPPRELTLDDLQWEEYIEPFVVNPPALLRNPEPFPAPEPLLQPFDPFSGQDPSAKTSRVALVGNRAIVYLPVLEARVGDTVDVPVVIETGPPIRATRVVVQYDPAVLKAVDVLHPEWQDILFNSNTEPDPELPKQYRVFGLAVSTEPWTGRVPIVLRFQAVGAGEAVLRAEAFEYTNPEFDNEPAVFRNGLVRVLP